MENKNKILKTAAVKESANEPISPTKTIEDLLPPEVSQIYNK